MPTAEPCNVTSIPSGASFLETLADQILHGHLIEGYSEFSSPFDLCQVQILLPTRRAVRSLQEILVRRLGPERPILPIIRPLGDLDEEELFFDALSDDVSPVEIASKLELPPAIGATSRRLVLTQLILHWSKRLADDHGAEKTGGPSLIPTSAADAAHLARDLAALIDDVTMEECDWSMLNDLAPEQFSHHWSIILEFLKIATEVWPKILADNGCIDVVDRRGQLMRLEAAQLGTQMEGAPVIAAGSTGSIPATAELLAAIARHPSGMVILPGLDKQLDNEDWQAIAPLDGAEAGDPGHPQYGMLRFLRRLGISPAEVRDLATVEPSLRYRGEMLSGAMQPGANLFRWAEAPPPDLTQCDAAFNGVDFIVTRNDGEEALTIAVALRQAIEEGDKKLALITPDRRLALRVQTELLRWNIEADDSAGQSLSMTPAGRMFRHLAAHNPFKVDPITLLGLLKHPLYRHGRSAGEARLDARRLERLLFRAGPVSGSLSDFSASLKSLQRNWQDAGEQHLSATQSGLGINDWQRAAILLDDLQAAFMPLDALAETHHDMALSAVVEALKKAAEALTNDENGNCLIWQGDDGKVLAEFLDGILTDTYSDIRISLSEIPGIIDALMGSQRVRPITTSDPRISVWGTLEARLQSPDLVILAGLNEGVWPGQPNVDAFLSRPMRAQLGLSPPERFIGLSAHDFISSFGAKRVIISRAERHQGAPAVPSRWLQRIEAFLPKSISKAMRERGDTLRNIAARLDAVAPHDVRPIAAPAPVPPIALRPRKLSITEIETWFRDPYAIYARHILKLRPFDPLAFEPDAAERGSLIHQILHHFAAENPHPIDEKAAHTHLLEIGRYAFSTLDAFPVVRALWWPRFQRIARWFAAEYLREMENGVTKRWPELAGKLEICGQGGSFILSGRIDRIDQLQDGKRRIIDYKTGEPPSGKQVRSLLAPQLPLEAAMLAKDAFGTGPSGNVNRLDYIHLTGNKPAAKVLSCLDKNTDPQHLADRAYEQLVALIALYDQPETGYPSRPRVQWQSRSFSPYDHLARVKEWSPLGGEDE